MSKLKDFSATPAENNAAPPFGFPEGMAPSAVNNAIRQLMASLREWYQDAEWVELGLPVLSASASTIVFTGNVAGFFAVGQAIKSDGVVGEVASITVATNTSIVVNGITFSGIPTIFQQAALARTLTSTLVNQAIGYVPLDAAGLTADLDAGGNKITNLADPVDSQDAATRSYVNATLIGGGDPTAIAITSLDNGFLDENELLTNDGTNAVLAVHKSEVIPSNYMYLVASGVI